MNTVMQAFARIRQTADQLEKTIAKYDMGAPEFGQPCTVAEVDELKKLMRRTLPDDFREYLLACRKIDAPEIYNGYYLFSPMFIVARDDSRPQKLHIKLNGQLDEVLVLPIGGDGGGNLFLLGTSPNASGVVWKWCHEYEVRFDGMVNKGLEQLAPSFTEFLERICDDWEHFLAGDKSWKYISG